MIDGVSQVGDRDLRRRVDGSKALGRGDGEEIGCDGGRYRSTGHRLRVVSARLWRMKEEVDWHCWCVASREPRCADEDARREDDAGD
jgi:hypothetical protein